MILLNSVIAQLAWANPGAALGVFVKALVKATEPEQAAQMIEQESTLSPKALFVGTPLLPEDSSPLFSSPSICLPSQTLTFFYMKKKGRVWLRETT